MNWQKIVLISFLLAIVFTYAPMVTLIAGAIILAIYGRQDIRNLTGQSIGFAQVLFLGFAIAVMVQVLMTIIFGASFDALYQEFGLYAALKNPGAIKVEVIKEIFALVIVFCATYLVVTATTPQRWLFKLAIVLSILALMFQCWNENAPLFAGSTARHSMRLSLLREEVLANFDSRIKSVGLSLNRNTVINEHIADMPTTYFATANAYLYHKNEDGVVERGELVEVDSQWFHLVAGETITDQVTGVIYEPVASYDDEIKIGWLRVDKLSQSPAVVKLVTPQTPPPTEALTVPTKPLANPKAEGEELPAPAKIELSRNSVLVGNNWTQTGFDNKFGDRYQLGPFGYLEDVQRLEVKVGDQVFSNLKYDSTSSGPVVVLNFSGHGDNIGRRPVELKIANGLPLTVAIQKL